MRTLQGTPPATQNIEEFERQYYNQGIEEIKQRVLLLYLKSPLKISKTLRPGIVALADVLFPSRWPDLLDNLLAYVAQQPASIAAVLKLLQSITHKYSYESRSDPLYEEIIFMCDRVHDFLLELTLSVLQRVQTNPRGTEDVVVLEILMKVYYNLNYQDLHPKFEDNVASWMAILKEIMNI